MGVLCEEVKKHNVGLWFYGASVVVITLVGHSLHGSPGDGLKMNIAMQGNILGFIFELALFCVLYHGKHKGLCCMKKISECSVLINVHVTYSSTV